MPDTPEIPKKKRGPYRKKGDPVEPAVAPNPIGRPKADKSGKEWDVISEKDRDETVQIITRFFEVFDAPHKAGNPVSIYEFCKKHLLNRTNIYSIKRDPDKRRLPVVYLKYMAEDFNVSIEWVLTGKGKMFKN